jgi:hypothetical protein
VSSSAESQQLKVPRCIHCVWRQRRSSKEAGGKEASSRDRCGGCGHPLPLLLLPCPHPHAAPHVPHRKWRQVTDHRAAFSKWWVTEWKGVQFPEKGSVYDYYVDPETCLMVKGGDRGLKCLHQMFFSCCAGVATEKGCCRPAQCTKQRATKVHTLFLHPL